MFSSAVSVGTRLNDWKTNPIWSRRSRVSALSPSEPSSWSPIITWPSPEVLAGLGAGMAQALAAAGAAVMIGDVLDDLAGQTASGFGGEATHLDVSDEASWEVAVAATVEQLGGLDILINNAGIELSGLFVDAEAADLRRMLEVNVLGTALGIKHGLRAMRPGGAAGNGGAIVNIASVAATIAFPGIGGYSATKSAVDRLTRVAAFEAGKLGFGVRVNCVYPGLVPTAMGQKLAVDMAELGLFASPEAAVGAVI